jgi:glutathione peroxidase-family protein
MKSLLALAILLLGFTFTYAQHEYESAKESELNYKDWTYKSVRDGKELNLRSLTAGKKLVLVVYFAPWCGNWNFEAPVAQKLYDKYKDNGFEIIGVSEYAPTDATIKNLTDKQITFPVVWESDSRDAKTTTTHYQYRQQTGDKRNWGSPWNIFLEPASLTKSGEVLTSKAYTVNGELIEAEIEKYIREKLGLPAEDSNASSGGNCDE